jgi:multiple sugar transport system permease protein
MFAMATLSLVPVIAIFFLLQRYIVEGISTTGLKA